MIVTSEDVPSAGVDGEESVEVLVTDDTGDVVPLPATQEIIQEVGEVRIIILVTASVCCICAKSMFTASSIAVSEITAFP